MAPRRRRVLHLGGHDPDDQGQVKRRFGGRGLIRHAQMGDRNEYVKGVHLPRSERKLRMDGFILVLMGLREVIYL